MTTGRNHRASGSESDTDAWRAFREWCIWYLEEFLRCLRDHKEGLDYRVHEAWVKTCPFSRRQLRELPDSIRALHDDLTGVVSEAVAVREALPGEFDELVAFLEKRLLILKENASEDDVWEAIESEEAW